MKRVATMLCLFSFFLGCGRQQASTSRESCVLSPAVESRVSTLLSDAEAQAKTKAYAASDSLATCAMVLLDTCDNRVWRYRCHYRLTMNAWYNSRREEALQQCSNWSDQAATVADSISGYYYSLTGWMHFVQGDFAAARPLLEKAADLLETAGRREKLPGVYNNLAPCLIRLGDYESAAHYLHAAIRLNTARRDTARLAINYYNLGRNYNAYGQSDKAMACFQQSAMFQGEKDADYFEGMTKAYANKRDYVRAQEFARQNLEAVEAEGGDDSAVAGALQWLGLVEAGQERHQKAVSYYRRALEHWRAAKDTAHYDFGKTNIFLGDSYAALRQPAKALSYYQAALCSFIPGLPKNDPAYNPTIAQLPNEIWVMEALRGKAAAWEQCFEANHDTLLLQNALRAAEAAALAMVHMKSLYEEDLSRLNLDQYGSLRFFEKAIQLACRMAEETKNKAYLQLAFRFSQRSKAGILRHALMERFAEYSALMPRDSLRKMDRLQMEIALLDRQRNLAQDPQVQDSLENQRFQRKRAWKRIQQQVGRALPKTPLPADVDLSTLQQRLPAGDLLLEYFVGENHLYTFAVTADGFDMFESAMPAGFQSSCNLFNRALSDLNWVRDSAAFAEKAYLTQASGLYTCLLADAIHRFPDTRRLRIVPDGALGRIPFSALLTQPYTGSWRDTDLPLVLRQFTVSTLYSSALLEAGQNVREPVYGFGGFGADYRDPWTLQGLKGADLPGSFGFGRRGDPGVLDHADDEVDSIARMTNGGKWLNEQATKANFLQEGERFGLIHLALHTIAAAPNDLSGFYLVFTKTNQYEDNYLSANELASLDLHAELAVVSACYSGLGSFQQGEGTMSLGRAFALSGCPATLVNLWEANDEVSKRIMIRFYKALQSGVSKDVALQQAQLEYLQQTPSAESIPFFWANFVVMGDVSPLHLPEPKRWWDWLVFWR